LCSLFSIKKTKLNKMSDNIPEPVRTGLNDYSATTCGKHVTVYCWSRSEPGSDRWIQAETLGSELAKRGFGVTTGGYGGSMAAVSRGARMEIHRSFPSSPAMPYNAAPSGDRILKVQTFHEVTEIDGQTAPKSSPNTSQSESVVVRGILVPGQFPDRMLIGNKYLTEAVDSRSMLHRLDLLSSLTRYYVVLPGTLGTLTELVLVWQNSALHAKGLDRPVILAFRDPWEQVVKSCCSLLEISKDFEEAIQFVDTPQEAAEKILADYNERIAATVKKE
jgi:predicted Rossmann-fold nucleotide-binding protein